jgi:hypothetical protein
LSTDHSSHVDVWLRLRLQTLFHGAKLPQPTPALMLANQEASFVGDFIFQGFFSLQEKASHLKRWSWACL